MQRQRGILCRVHPRCWKWRGRRSADNAAEDLLEDRMAAAGDISYSLNLEAAELGVVFASLERDGDCVRPITSPPTQAKSRSGPQSAGPKPLGHRRSLS
jgi:hypothetical protein